MGRASSTGCKPVTGHTAKTGQKEGRQLLLGLWGAGPEVTAGTGGLLTGLVEGRLRPSDEVTAGQGQGEAVTDPGRRMSGPVQSRGGERGGHQQPHVPE